MSNKSSGRLPETESSLRRLLEPHKIALGFIWLATSVAGFMMLWLGVRETDEYGALRHLLHACYVAVLLWYLGRSGPSHDKLLETRPARFQSSKFGVWAPAVVIFLVFVLTIVSEDGVNILMLLMLVGLTWTLIAWRKEIELRPVVLGLAATLVVYLAGLPVVANGFVGETIFYLFVILTPPSYVAGGLLAKHTRLGGVQLVTGQYKKAFQGFLLGCLLFVPHGLLNAAEGSPGSDIDWVNSFWMPFSLPWYSSISEETWFRLLLVGLCFFLLRPAFRKHPAIAVAVVVLFSGITFGLGHGRTVERFLTTGLLYGVPMAAVFARRDFEHAAGAHYMVNFIPWITVFLENDPG
jgi:hypothetical protein